MFYDTVHPSVTAHQSHKLGENAHKIGGGGHRSAGDGGEGGGTDGASQKTQHFDFEFWAAES